MNSVSMTLTETSVHTSFVQFFGKTINGVKIHEIEIPLIQRDYAQGRMNDRVRLIRERFIADLCFALEDGNEGIDLDFVFGDVENGKFFPLDGQQRLTTLFLVHCYLAWHGTEIAEQPWHAFSYATRPGARTFCKFLVKCRPDMTLTKLSEWLKDDSDYLPTWRHDPTIQSMLVVLDALHSKYIGKTSQAHTAWNRLTDTKNPAIRFHLLPMKAIGFTDKLYIKMNSRGRPLTEFENFKADFEELLRKNASIAIDKVDEFSCKIDTEWSDLFWLYRGDKDLIDEEFMRYFRFAFEVLAWKNNISFSQSERDDDLAAKVFQSEESQVAANLEWLMQALDVWMEVDATAITKTKPKNIKSEFEQIITKSNTGSPTPLRMFNFRDFDEQHIGVDMFHACCEHYGKRVWSLAHTLFFYGVVLGFIENTPKELLAHSLRLLRNLIEASSDDIRAGERNNMPKLLGDVEQIIAYNYLGAVSTFNQVQVVNEQAKQALLLAHPELTDDMYSLEDHSLLRGGLTVFDLSPSQTNTAFQNRAEQFHALFANPYSQVTGALLTKGNYGRSLKLRPSGHQFMYLGAPKNNEPWENLFRARSGEIPHPSSSALMALLDDMADGKSLQNIIDIFLNDTNTLKDWRYYVVKYEAMRCGESGCYVISQGSGYSLCMLKGDSCDDRSAHYDPYLMALAEEAQLEPHRIGNPGWPRCFPGYEDNARFLVLQTSGLKIRCAIDGWQIETTSLDLTQLTAYAQIVGKYGIQNCPTDPNEWVYAVGQHNSVDMSDRIVQGAKLLKALVSTGL